MEGIILVDLETLPVGKELEPTLLFSDCIMANNDPTVNILKSRVKKGNTRMSKDDATARARTVEMLQKLEKMEEKSPSNNNNNMLGAIDLPMRKSASFQNITELSEDCPMDLGRRGSDPRSTPSRPVGVKRDASGKRQKPWELRRSSTPTPGSLDVSSILRTALGRFSPDVGHTSVKEGEESDDQ